MKLLVVEDERKVASFLEKGLLEAGYSVDTAADGSEGLRRALNGAYDVIILDIMLPEMDGFELLTQLRRREVPSKVLLLTALGEVQDKIRGLNLGGDDYLTKPFDFQELLARVNALLRRSGTEKKEILTAADLRLEPLTQKVYRAGREIELTAKEFHLLEYLLEHKNEVVTRIMISQHVWDHGFDTGTNVIDVYINYLRRKIDRAHEVKLIHTVRGRGYMLVDES